VNRVAIWAFNSYEWVVALLGLLRAGAVLVPINTRFKGAEAADILLRSRARVLVTVTDFLGTDYISLPGGERRGAARPRHDHRRPGPVPARARSWADVMGHGRRTPAARRPIGAAPPWGPLTLRTFLFTSGTTGSPKGVVQTHVGRCASPPTGSP